MDKSFTKSDEKHNTWHSLPYYSNASFFRMAVFLWVRDWFLVYHMAISQLLGFITSFHSQKIFFMWKDLSVLVQLYVLIFILIPEYIIYRIFFSSCSPESRAVMKELHNQVCFTQLNVFIHQNPRKPNCSLHYSYQQLLGLSHRLENCWTPLCFPLVQQGMQAYSDITPTSRWENVLSEQLHAQSRCW